MSDEATSSNPTTSTTPDATKPKTGKTLGRPSSYNEPTAKTICERLANGETLRSIIRSDPAMPDRTTIYRWLESNEDFRNRYAHARAEQADYYAEQIVDEAMTSHDAQIGRLRMDALKWAASKMAPKKYGERIEVDSKSEQNITIQFQIPGRVERVELESNTPILPLPDADLEATDGGQNNKEIEW